MQWEHLTLSFVGHNKNGFKRIVTGKRSLISFETPSYGFPEEHICLEYCEVHVMHLADYSQVSQHIFQSLSNVFQNIMKKQRDCTRFLCAV